MLFIVTVLIRFNTLKLHSAVVKNITKEIHFDMYITSKHNFLFSEVGAVSLEKRQTKRFRIFEENLPILPSIRLYKSEKKKETLTSFIVRP